MELCTTCEEKTDMTTEEHVTCEQLLLMIAEETKRVTSTTTKDATTQDVEEKLTGVIQIHYSDAKEGMKDALFNLVQEVLMDNVHEGRLDTLLVKKVDTLKRSDSFMDALTQCMLSNKSLNTHVATSIKHHIEKIGEESRLQRALE